MSSNLEFRHAAFRVDTTAGLAAMAVLANIAFSEYQQWQFAQPAHLVFVEAGDNNVIAWDTNKVARRWELRFGGTHMIYDVMLAAMDAEGGCLKPFGRSISAEGYIGLYRRLMNQARELATLADLGGTFAVRLAEQLFAGRLQEAERVHEHPFTPYLIAEGLLEVPVDWHANRDPVGHDVRLRIPCGDLQRMHACTTWLVNVASGYKARPHFYLDRDSEPGLNSVLDRLLQGERQQRYLERMRGGG